MYWNPQPLKGWGYVFFKRAPQFNNPTLQRGERVVLQLGFSPDSILHHHYIRKILIPIKPFYFSEVKVRLKSYQSMKKSYSSLLLSCLISGVFSLHAHAQLGPEVTSWIINTNGATGYHGIPSNVQKVQYSNDYVYVSSTCIPGYNIGPWPGNPNIPVNQNFVFKITRHPQQNTGTPTATPLGHTGIWSNGVSIFNASDAQSYNNQDIWHRNAYFWEEVSFDDCLGHPNQDGEYHHHVNPKCLYDETDSSKHSPIIGYAFDGYPIYGAFGYKNADGTGGVTRMRTSYQTMNYTTRTNGPDVNTQYPMGCFLEDFEFVSGSGDLDEHNGRFCKTPEYPNGTYAYFVTIGEDLQPAYPYTMGPTYYGMVVAGNTGHNSGHVSITEQVTTYTTSGIEEASASFEPLLYPNPANRFVSVYTSANAENNMTLTIMDATGRIVYTQTNVQPAVSYTLSTETFRAGLYLLKLSGRSGEKTSRFIVQH